MSVRKEIEKSLDRIASIFEETSDPNSQNVDLQLADLKLEIQATRDSIADLSDRIDLLEWAESSDEESDEKSRWKVLKWLRVPKVDPKATGLLLLSCVFMFATAVGIGWLVRTLL